LEGSEANELFHITGEARKNRLRRIKSLLDGPEVSFGGHKSLRLPMSYQHNDLFFAPTEMFERNYRSTEIELILLG
jgi:hypothetical protein